MAKQNQSENRKTRSETKKALFSRGILHRTNVETRWVEIELAYTGWRTEVVYQYREIKPNKPNCSLISGWKHVVDFLEIHQGDRVYFEGRPDMPWLLRVSRDKYPDAVKVEDEYWA
ncbi:hypothetical protein C2S52_012390 [Perilla frutescens var. hirtella]|nr:hypothetical protein C2S52_012390 [Perilla frutescens var. hirtella]